MPDTADAPPPPREPVSARPASPAELWAEVLRAAAAAPRLLSIIEEFRLDSLERDTAVLVGRGPLVNTARASSEAIADLFARAGGRAVKVEIRGERAADEEPGPGSGSPQLNLGEHALVKQAMELFNVRTPIRVLARKQQEG